MTSLLTFSDTGAQTNYRVNAAAGEFGILSCSVGGAFDPAVCATSSAGLIFYQAGVIVLTSSIFQGICTGSLATDADAMLNDNALTTISGALTGTAISGCC